MKYDKVRKTPSQLLSLTGFTPEEFEAFVPTFEYHWNEYYSDVASLVLTVWSCSLLTDSITLE